MAYREEFEAKLKLVDSSLNQTRDYPYDVETDDYDDYLINNIYHGFKMGVEHAKAQAVPQWISVSERLPEHKDGMWSDPVIAMSDTGDVFRLSYCGGWQCTGYFMSTGSSKATHWMPLPAAPEIIK